MMKRKVFLREMTLYTIIIVVIIIMVFLLFSGRRWMMGPMHDQDNNSNNPTEMNSNPN